jgi:hypothetical protein
VPRVNAALGNRKQGEVSPMSIIDILRPKWKYGDTQARKDAVRKLTNQVLLARIAQTDEDGDVRLSAISMITDQALLVSLAQENDFRDIGLAAVKMLTDEALLANVDRKTDSIVAGPAALVAIERISAQPILADLAKTAKPNEIRLAAIAKISDQALLADVAKVDRSSDIRSAALAKLTDETLLVDVAMSDEYGEYCLEAIKHLAEIKDSWLAQKVVGIANTTHFVACRLNELQAAIKKFTDQALLTDLAKQANFEKIRLAAAETITDQALLADLAVNAKPDVVRKVAVKKITDQTLIAAIAQKDEDWFIGEAVTKIITDQTLLTDLAMNAESDDVRLAAAEKLSDQTLEQKILVDVAMNRKYFGSQIVEKISDQEPLGRLAVNAESDDVRLAAAKKLTDQAHAQKLLADLAKEGNSSFNERIRMEAVARITDQTLLANLAMNAASDDARVAAAEKIADQALAQCAFANIAISKPLYESLGPEYGSDGFSIPGSSVDVLGFGHKMLSKITDQKHLYRIAGSAKFLDMRLAAVGKISDPVTLSELANNADSPKVREAAARLLARMPR